MHIQYFILPLNYSWWVWLMTGGHVVGGEATVTVKQPLDSVLLVEAVICVYVTPIPSWCVFILYYTYIQSVYSCVYSYTYRYILHVN